MEIILHIIEGSGGKGSPRIRLGQCITRIFLGILN
jgi:hypothetical protein